LAYLAIITTLSLCQRKIILPKGCIIASGITKTTSAARGAVRTHFGARTLIDKSHKIPENSEGVGGIVFIDEPAVIRAIRAIAPDAHIVVLPGPVVDGVVAATLTRRERAVLARVATGKTNAEIADAMGLAHNTVKAYLQSLMRKLGARNRIEALAYARTHGIV
jgi:DNA-binding CsgD family transcriptional regulator